MKVKEIAPLQYLQELQLCSLNTALKNRWLAFSCIQQRVLPVDVNGLQQPKSHPGPQEEDVVTEDHDSNKETSTEDDGLSRVGVLCLHAKWSLEKRTN